MVELFAKYRWSFIARGVVAFLFGLIILARGSSSLDLLVSVVRDFCSSPGDTLGRSWA